MQIAEAAGAPRRDDRARPARSIARSVHADGALGQSRPLARSLRRHRACGRISRTAEVTRAAQSAARGDRRGSARSRTAWRSARCRRSSTARTIPTAARRRVSAAASSVGAARPRRAGALPPDLDPAGNGAHVRGVGSSARGSARARSMRASAIGAARRRSRSGRKDFTAPIPAPRSRIVMVDRPQSPQSVIYAGAVLPISGSDDTLTLNAANEVLGNNFLSRINTEIRERRGWSYGLSGAGAAARAPGALHHQRAGAGGPHRRLDPRADLADQRVQLAPMASPRPSTRAPSTATSASCRARTKPPAAVLGALRSNELYDRPDNYWESVALALSRHDGGADGCRRARGDRSVAVRLGGGRRCVGRAAAAARLGLDVEVVQPARS